MWRRLGNVLSRSCAITRLASAISFKGDADVWRWRDDVDILENMWTLAKRVKELLNVRGWTLQYAQSTYRSLRQEACEKEPDGKTRSQSSFSVDLTVVRDKFTFWWEHQVADSNNLSWSTCAAFVKFPGYLQKR